MQRLLLCQHRLASIYIALFSKSNAMNGLNFAAFVTGVGYLDFTVPNTDFRSGCCMIIQRINSDFIQIPMRPPRWFWTTHRWQQQVILMGIIVFLLRPLTRQSGKTPIPPSLEIHMGMDSVNGGGIDICSKQITLK